MFMIIDRSGNAETDGGGTLGVPRVELVSFRVKLGGCPLRAPSQICTSAIYA
jgi:hypothetical protein